MKGSQGKNSGRNRIEAGEGLCLLACSPWLAWFSFNFLSFFVFKFVRTWFLGSHGYPGTYSVDQAVFNLPALASQVLGLTMLHLHLQEEWHPNTTEDMAIQSHPDD